MKLDILVLASHPDDAEISCSGTILSHVAQGKKVGIADLTKGEMGTRGNPELRMIEAMKSAKILGLAVRENLGFRDGFFSNDEAHQLEVIRIVRKYRPEIVLANAVSDRHTDHGMGAALAKDACFLSGLAKIKTVNEGNEQDAWRPKAVYHYIQNNFIKPDIIVDITGHWEKKMESIKAYKSQFFDPNNDEPETFISQPGFLDFLHSRAREFGHAIGTKYGEGYTVSKQMGVKSLFDLL
jgi:N-acetylglucosamine malate deacetylase 1